MANTLSPGPEKSKNPGFGLRRKIGLIGGIFVFGLMLILPAPEGLSTEAWNVAAVGALMAIFWICESIPIPATALLPIFLFPVLGIANIKDASSPYANPLIFLFLGGFMLALAMQRWELHKRIALVIINAIGTRPSSIIGGFMAATAFLSMWVSNTATTMMLLPIAVSVINLLESGSDFRETPNFAIALMLGIAYAANIGGFGTLIGTPPNALLAGFMNETYNVEVGFGQWMLLGVPLVVASLPMVYWVLTRIAFPLKVEAIEGGDELVRSELRKLGDITRPELQVAAVFTLTAFLWIVRPFLADHLPGLSDAGIAIFAGLLLFMMPVSFKDATFILNWEWAQRLPWGVLLLFGGGLSLAANINSTGLATWIGGTLAGVGGVPTVLLIFLVAALVVFLTEITSNTATTAAFLPILASVAIGIGQNPLILLVAASVSASCAFMLPVATPPNAIVYGSGYLTIPQMARTGIWLNVLFIFLITAMVYTGLPVVFGVEYGVLPEWVP